MQKAVDDLKVDSARGAVEGFVRAIMLDIIAFPIQIVFYSHRPYMNILL